MGAPKLKTIPGEGVGAGCEGSVGVGCGSVGVGVTTVPPLEVDAGLRPPPPRLPQAVNTTAKRMHVPKFTHRRVKTNFSIKTSKNPLVSPTRIGTVEAVRPTTRVVRLCTESPGGTVQVQARRLAGPRLGDCQQEGNIKEEQAVMIRGLVQSLTNYFRYLEPPQKQLVILN